MQPSEMIELKLLTDEYLEFLINEYNKTFDYLIKSSESYDKIIKNNYYFNAALMSIFTIFSKTDLSFTVIGTVTVNDVKELAMFIMPILAILCNVSCILSTIKTRKKEIWCYSRMNLIRKIFLDKNSHNETSLKQYIDSKYGCTIELNTKNNVNIDHESLYNLVVIELMMIIWFLLLIMFAVPVKMIPFLFVTLSMLFIFFSKKIYLSLINMKI